MFQQGHGHGRERGFTNTTMVTRYAVCVKIGHTVQSCYFKHRFPLGLKFRDKQTSINNIEGETSDDTAVFSTHNDTNSAPASNSSKFHNLYNTTLLIQGGPGVLDVYVGHMSNTYQNNKYTIELCYFPESLSMSMCLCHAQCPCFKVHNHFWYVQEIAGSTESYQYLNQLKCESQSRYLFFFF